MNKTYSIISIILIAILSAGCAQSIEEKQLVKDDDNITIKLEAVVVPSINQDILSPFEGQISKVYKKNGSIIKKGDLLFQFDIKDALVDIDNLQDEIKIIKMQLDILEKNKNLKNDIADNARISLEKITALHADGYATQSELSNATKEYYIQKNTTKEKLYNSQQNKNQLLIQLNEKKSALKKAKFTIDNASVRSNYTGYLVGSNIKVGSQVAKNSSMGSIINIDNVTVKAGLAPGLYRFIKEGESVHIDFIVTPPYSVDANITRIIPVVDPKFGRMVVDIKLKNSNFILQDGMKAMVKIKLKKEYQETVREYFIDKKDQKIVEIGSDIE
jgi:multidrug resistance efflux pump